MGKGEDGGGVGESRGGEEVRCGDGGVGKGVEKGGKEDRKRVKKSVKKGA